LRSFDQLIGLLGEIPDPRRAEGKLYKLSCVLLFSILAVVTGGNSYRSIETFISDLRESPAGFQRPSRSEGMRVCKYRSSYYSVNTFSSCCCACAYVSAA
jgi:hypothetical protein